MTVRSYKPNVSQLFKDITIMTVKLCHSYSSFVKRHLQQAMFHIWGFTGPNFKQVQKGLIS